MKKLSILIIIFLISLKGLQASVTLILPNLEGNQGTQISVPVKVKNFTDIISVQGTLQFNPAVVGFLSISQTGLPGMMPSNFGTSQVSNGILTFAWTDETLSGKTLADSAVLFTINFQVTGTSGQFSNLEFTNVPTLIEIINASLNSENVIVVNGGIQVQNIIQNPQIGFYLDSVSGNSGSQVMVSMKTVDFINIISVQGSIQWDPAVATYAGVTNFSLPGLDPGNFGTSQTGVGKLSFAWTDPQLAGVDLADHSDLFSIIFELTGNPGSTSMVNLSNVPVTFEVLDSALQILNTSLSSGQIQINSQGAVNGITLHCDTTSGPQGAQVLVSVYAENFTNIISMQGTLAFNPEIASFDSIYFFGLPDLNSGSFGLSQIGSGVLLYSWIDPLLSGVTISPQTPLFTMEFTLVGSSGSQTEINFVEAPMPQEFMNSNLEILADTLWPGLIMVTGSYGLAVNNPQNMDLCAGDALTVNYTVTSPLLPGNQFILQLSDATGNFGSSTILATQNGQNSGVFNTIVPAGTIAGSAYRLRVVTTHPALTSPPNPDPIAIHHPDPPTIGVNSLILTSSYASGNQWFFNGSAIPGAVSQSYTVTQNGYYFVLFTDIWGCQTASDSVHVVWVGVEHIEYSQPFIMYPNPVHRQLTLEMNQELKGNSALSIFTIQGQEIMHQLLAKGLTRIEVELNNLLPGIYMVEVNADEGVFRKKMIVE